MANSSGDPKGIFQPDSDVHITFEDQQKINKFARQNAKLEDLKEELKNKQNEMQNLNDACEELLLVDDEEAFVPYLVGEVFIYQSVEDTQQTLEEAKTKLQKEISEIEAECEVIKGGMSELKTQLYAKFGDNINLEAEEE